MFSQKYDNVESIIIDGASDDGTIEVINQVLETYKGRAFKFISEKDKGVYDAMNKGIALASGDIIGFLNSDDIFANQSALNLIAKTLSDENIDACYSDLIYVDKCDTNRTRRYWKSCEYEYGMQKKGWIPPHPTFYAKKKVFDKYGVFDLNYKLAADYELMTRFLARHEVRSAYIPEVLVKMRIGGVTNNLLSSVIRQNIEILRACKKNGINVSPLPFMIKKVVSRLYQYIH